MIDQNQLWRMRSDLKIRTDVKIVQIIAERFSFRTFRWVLVVLILLAHEALSYVEVLRVLEVRIAESYKNKLRFKIDFMATSKYLLDKITSVGT